MDEPRVLVVIGGCYEEESGSHASKLLERTLIAEQHTCCQLVMHSDNGASMKSQTLSERHQGKDTVVLEKRASVLNEAKVAHPERWGSWEIRNCSPVGPVSLKPEKSKSSDLKAA